MSDIILKVDGVKYGGWTEIVVQQSLDMIADAFELSLTDRWSESSEPRPIIVGSECEVAIDDETVITGHIDDVFPEYDAESHSIIVNGRSRLGDLVDSSVNSKEWKERKLDQIARDILKDFNINLVVETDIGDVFKQERISAGDSPFEFLNKLCQRRAVRMISNTNGDLVITRTGTQRIKTALKLGDNIQSAAGEFTNRDRFNRYTVLGQSNGSSLSWTSSANKSAFVVDSTIKRHRPYVNVFDGNVEIADCKKLAQWESNTRYGRSQSIVYTVRGWQHADGLWQINQLVPVEDAFMGIAEDRLITEVRFLMDDKGQRTELRVMPKEAYDLVALPDDSEDAGGWS